MKRCVIPRSVTARVGPKDIKSVRFRGFVLLVAQGGFPIDQIWAVLVLFQCAGRDCGIGSGNPAANVIEWVKNPEEFGITADFNVRIHHQTPECEVLLP